MMPTLSSPAPDFRLADQDGAVHSLSDERGHWVLLYFYPEDDTSGCTTEACGIRDRFAELREKGCVVFGVSADSQESHRKFIAKYGLPFTLLSDESKSVIETYGAWREKHKFGKTYMGIARISFLIDPEGVIRKIYDPVKPEEHAGEVMKDLHEMTHSKDEDMGQS